MKRYGRLCALVALVPGIALLLGNVGCSGGSGDNKHARNSEEKRVTERTSKSKSGAGEGGEATTSGGAEEALVAKGYGTLKGKVTFQGDPPPVKDIQIPTSVKERDQCLQGDTRVQTWKVGPDKGVGDVVVWLRAPKGKYFKLPADEQKAEPSLVKLDQPHCAFVPHVFVLYPSYFDGTKQQKTGQTFEVVNSAPFNHNTNWTPSDQLLNSGGNVILQAHSGKQEIPFKAAKDKKAGGEQQIQFTCNIHPWMSAYARVFDHPYATVTTGDEKEAKDYGTYEIKKVPAGVAVELVYWHEALGAPKVLKTVTLKEGDNTEDFSISQ